MTGSQALTWDVQGNLASDTEGTRTTGYVYDADGNLLIRRAPNGNGESVIYLGTTEIHVKTSGSTTTTWQNRSYTLGDSGPVIGERTTQPGTPALSWLTGDQHGTSTLSMDAATQAITNRYTTPFGADRGTTPTNWPDDKGFLGKPDDSTTGLTSIGARQYDPTTGRFISVDPQLDLADPQSLNGYAYADNNPTTDSDPTGRMLYDSDTGAEGAGVSI
jgi:RHS repeat-associated protein